MIRTIASKNPLRRMVALCLAAAAVVAGPAGAQEKLLNLYSARHYQTDEALYDNFTKATGIRIQRVEADDAGILARLQAEGTSSPADVILLVDASRLWRGEQDGLFQPVKSALLQQRVPAQFRGAETAQGAQWYGMSTRARLVIYDKSRLKASDVDTYAFPFAARGICASALAVEVESDDGRHSRSLPGCVRSLCWASARRYSWMGAEISAVTRTPSPGEPRPMRRVARG